MWTLFWDMHSGGGQKEKWNLIFIESEEKTARIIFYNRFGHNPDRVTCTCCGNDYSISEGESLNQITAYHRGCKWDDKLHKYIEEPDLIWDTTRCKTLEQFEHEPNVLIIREKEIKSSEKIGDVPKQGYIWVG